MSNTNWVRCTSCSRGIIFGSVRNKKLKDEVCRCGGHFEPMEFLRFVGTVPFDAAAIYQSIKTKQAYVWDRNSKIFLAMQQ